MILDIIFPKKCLGCGNNESIICKNCQNLIHQSENYADETDSSVLPLIAAACYKNKIIKKTIWLLKYKKIKVAAEPLSELIYSRSVEDLSEINIFYSIKDCLIIPVPLSKKRLKERGFNQAELIASNLMVKLKEGIPAINFSLEKNILRKIKETSSQVIAKDKSKRLKNLKGSFGIEHPEKIKGRNIILIDDVSTTGATLHEATSVLKKAGARIVIPIVAAR